MLVDTLMVLVCFIVAVFLWWRFFRSPRPRLMPLEIDPGDQLMQEAMKKARTTIEDFRRYLDSDHRSANVKVPFETSSGNTEFLWAEFLRFRGAQMEVRLTTPPVTHTGRVERLREYPVSDLVDWVVELPDGRYAGGYTMRVMFVKGREQWGMLPEELLKEEKKYL
jgi:uncharacterized protein YegJ (DUF2314 family)